MKNDKTQTAENPDLFWMPVYLEKMISGTSHMSAAEFGGYLRLLMEQFKKGSVPDDVRALKRISGLKNSALVVVLTKFKKVGEAGLQNKRCEIVRQEQLEKYFTNKERASRGGVAKQIKRTNGVLEAPGKQSASSASGVLNECLQGADIRIKNLEIRNKECVQELRKKSVDDAGWLAKISSAHGLNTHTIQTFCNEWITNAELRFITEDYPVNKVISMMLEDLAEEKPKLQPPPKKERAEADRW